VSLKVLIRGGGDLASGVVARVHRAGWKVLVTELVQPLSVRRTVSFSQAIYSGEVTIEGIVGQRVEQIEEIPSVHAQNRVAVVIDPKADSRTIFEPDILVDGRMLKRPPDLGISVAKLVIGLGPGFIAGENCHAAIETKRGHKLGRVIWSGSPDPDSGIPEAIGGVQSDRVIRAPCDGEIIPKKNIGDVLDKGELIATIGSCQVVANFDGVLRGLAHGGLVVNRGMKVGDLDPRGDPELCFLISDKALAIGGGVLEAILSSFVFNGNSCE
jgi:xanthine dehydrogenase accessory factor